MPPTEAGNRHMHRLKAAEAIPPANVVSGQVNDASG